MKQNNPDKKKIPDSFVEICKTKFNFLITEYGFSLAPVPRYLRLHRVIYLNKTTAVKVNLDQRENWIYLELYCLVDGKLVTNPIMISDQTKLNGYNLDDLLSIRCPDFDVANIIGKKHSEVLDFYSVMLREYGSDVLNGDFKIFIELEKIVRSRILRLTEHN